MRHAPRRRDRDLPVLGHRGLDAAPRRARRRGVHGRPRAPGRDPARGVRAHGGREEGTEGDSFFVVFDSAREAVEAAVEGQRDLATEPWPGGVEVRVRMGLHAGEAIGLGRGPRRARHQPRGADRRRGARRPGRGLRRGPHARRRRTCRRAISLRGLGNHRLKDLREPQPLCQVVADGLRLEFPPLRSLDARPNNLPTQLTRSSAASASSGRRARCSRRTGSSR